MLTNHLGKGKNWWSTVAVTLSGVVMALSASTVLTPRMASAKNYCITGFPDTAWNDVGIGFKVPLKGKCKAWLGFNPANGDNAPTSGVGCTSSDGANLTLSITVADEVFQFVEFDQISLSLPSGTGTGSCQVLESNATVSCGGFSGLVGGTCTTATVPAVKSGSQPVPMLGNGSPVH